MKLTHSFFVVCALAGVACGDLPQPSVANGSSSSTSTSTDTESVIPDPPTVYVVSTTTTSNVVVTGYAEINTANPVNVLVEGGQTTNTAVPADSSTGAFCLVVPLNEGKNVLSFKAQRQDGATSDATTKTVTYTISETEKTTRASTTSINAATGRSVGSSVSGTSLTNITDDDDTTYATFTSYPSLYIDLGGQWVVDAVEIVFASAATSGGQYADQYEVFMSTETSPTRPVESGTDGWTSIGSVDGSSGGNGDGDTDTFSFGTPVTTRWIGMDVTSNNTSWYSFDWGIWIAEIRVYGTKVSSSTGSSSSGDTSITCQ